MRNSMWSSLPVNNSSPLKINSWKLEDVMSFWVSIYFQVRTVSIKECNGVTSIQSFKITRCLEVRALLKIGAPGVNRHLNAPGTSRLLC